MDEIEIRRPRPQDLEPLTRLYNHYVVHSPATFDTQPLSLDARREWMHRRFGFETIGCFDEAGRKFDQFWSVLWFAKRLG